MSDDLISRQAAIELSCNVPIAPLIQGEGIHYEDIIFTDHIKSLPIVQPEQKTGRWIYKERNILINTSRISYGENGAVQEKRWAKVKKPYCSECGWYEESEYEATPYCPNCGAKMESDNNDS